MSYKISLPISSFLLFLSFQSSVFIPRFHFLSTMFFQPFDPLHPRNIAVNFSPSLHPIHNTSPSLFLSLSLHPSSIPFVLFCSQQVERSNRALLWNIDSLNSLSSDTTRDWTTTTNQPNLPASTIYICVIHLSTTWLREASNTAPRSIHGSVPLFSSCLSAQTTDALFDSHHVIAMPRLPLSSYHPPGFGAQGDRFPRTSWMNNRTEGYSWGTEWSEGTSRESCVEQSVAKLGDYKQPNRGPNYVVVPS
ncbi:hypothetical protein TRIATDRAFT_85742 [Trichoderma atroviride IMI 206040]|uniref:Uncharacterized protein n=1 Tax=Hypocrea atroviridis (strain ATCC 20476 / IMI 206040) TaxID=452589 RepID=G9P274_HYPAI|nr:uncharacterized protein TRIATDRAFT_85742 [Trichoderma atroviride IMI 206040]EHK43446.1 hypothetical protein TRIATDRAFT_85742 [Trichoderma atroviride IMI 206040]